MSDPMTDDWAAVWHRRNGSLAAILGVLARLSVVLLLSSGAFVWSSGEAAAPPPGGPFTLQDGDGKPVTDRDFRGKYMLVYFGYTFCPDACPTTLNAVADALDRLGAKADQIQAIFITVDPKRDTPAVMKQYVAAFSPHLIGLTGSPEQIAQVAKAYRVYHTENRTGPGPNDYSIDHSSVLYLMGPDGGFIAAFRADQSGAEIADDLSESMP
jgi:protein SCO1/2